MKKIILIILVLLFCISIYPSDVPLLFLHGHKKQALPWIVKPEGTVNMGGWGTWNPQNIDLTREHSSSMTDILDIQYGGYIAGTPLNCDKSSALTSTNGNTKIMYNYSFYHCNTFKTEYTYL